MTPDRAQLERAGLEIGGTWSEARVERTLRAAKRRARHRVLLRSSALGCVLAATWVLAREPWTEPVAAPEARPSVAEHVPTAVPEPSDPAARKAPATAAAGDGESAPSEVASGHRPESPGRGAGRKSDVRSGSTRLRLAGSEEHARATESWRGYLARGDVARAHALLETERPQLLALDDLMLAADAARRAGDPAAAVRHLRRALERHQGPRSAVVAFTLGRILHDELARPDEAARMFALVEERAPHAPLTHDALVREVQALHDAGQRERAGERARAYLRRFPSGEQRAWMQRLSAR